MTSFTEKIIGGACLASILYFPFILPVLYALWYHDEKKVEESYYCKKRGADVALAICVLSGIGGFLFFDDIFEKMFLSISLFSFLTWIYMHPEKIHPKKDNS